LSLKAILLSFYLLALASRKYLEVNAAAGDIELTTDELQNVSDVVRSTTVAGARFPAASLKAVNG
jgi:hypothetical protein